MTGDREEMERVYNKVVAFLEDIYNSRVCDDIMDCINGELQEYWGLYGGVELIDYVVAGLESGRNMGIFARGNRVLHADDADNLFSRLKRLKWNLLNEPQQVASTPAPMQVQPKQFTLPKELDNDEAAKYFAKAIEVGVMDDGYNWLKGLQLLSCFAREMSLKLGLGKAQNSDGTKRISWKPFEQLFKIDRGRLRSNYNDIQKIGQAPHDVYLIDKIFE